MSMCEFVLASAIIIIFINRNKVDIVIVVCIEIDEIIIFICSMMSLLLRSILLTDTILNVKNDIWIATWYYDWIEFELTTRLLVFWIWETIHEYQHDIMIELINYMENMLAVNMCLFAIDLSYCYYWPWIRRDVGIWICKKINNFTHHLIRQHIGVS